MIRPPLRIVKVRPEYVIDRSHDPHRKPWVRSALISFAIAAVAMACAWWLS